MYGSVMLFEGGAWATATEWMSHPFNASNNVNGVNGDSTSSTPPGIAMQTMCGAVACGTNVEAIQVAYLQHVIETVNLYDNVLYEVANESPGTLAWQNHIADVIHQYEQTQKPYMHPVGITSLGEMTIAHLSASQADWIGPYLGQFGDAAIDFANPPVASGTKPSIADTDHGQACTADAGAPWRLFTRGHNVQILLCNELTLCRGGSNTGAACTADSACPGGACVGVPNGDAATALAIQRNLADTAMYANGTSAHPAHLDLASVVPHGELSSTGFALANPGHQYLVYQPTNASFTLTTVAGTYTREWWSVVNHALAQAPDSYVATTGIQIFVPPVSGGVLLFLDRHRDANVHRHQCLY